MQTVVRPLARWTSILAAAGLAVTLSLPAAAAYPVNWNATAAVASGALADVPPAGANRTDCHPSAAHPDPVILVHGLISNQKTTWQALAPTLANAGYCVFTLTYGQVFYSGTLGGITKLESSAAELKTTVDKVLAQTGSAKVDIVGHSEGGNVPRLYLKNYGADKVARYVGLAAVNSGPPSASGIATVAEHIPGGKLIIDHGCPACGQMLDQGYFDQLDSPSATFPSVTYTNIATVHDEAVTPYRYAFLPAGSNVTNIRIQDLCPADPVGHIGITYDRTAVALTETALDPTHPVTPPCDTGFPL